MTVPLFNHSLISLPNLARVHGKGICMREKKKKQYIACYRIYSQRLNKVLPATGYTLKRQHTFYFFHNKLIDEYMLFRYV